MIFATIRRKERAEILQRFKEIIHKFLTAYRMVSQCKNCKCSSEKILLCQRCKLVSYCSKECQTIDWKIDHRRSCCLTQKVHKPNVTAFDNLRDAIYKSNVTVNDICDIMSRNHIDMKLVANKLLLEAASAGNQTVMDWLLLQESNLKPADIVDEKGRNLIMIVLIKQRKENLWNLLHHIVSKKIDAKIYEHTDQKGNNILHYAVLTKDIDLLKEFMLSPNFRDKLLFHVYRNEKIENIPFGASNKGLHQWENNDGNTPRDLALSMGQDIMVKAIDVFHIDMTLNLVARHLMYDSINGESTHDCKYVDDYKNWFFNFKNQFGENVVENLLTATKSTLMIAVNKFLANGNLDMLQWLDAEWKIDITMGEDNKVIINKVIAGPDNQNFSNDELKDEYCNETILSEIFNELFLEWDGRSDISIFINSLKIEKYSRDHIYEVPLYCAYEYCQYFYKFVDHFLLKIVGQKVQLRIKTLKWLLEETKVLNPSLCSFVFKGQHQLLQWYCSSKYIDIYAPLHSIPSFFIEMVNNNPWFTEISGKAISGNVSIVEALCVLAAGVGEFPIFCWLMREKVKTKGFIVNGMNILHVAAARGHLHIVKWLVKMDWLSLKKQTLSGMSACHLALNGNHACVGLYLLEIPDMKELKDSEGRTNHWYASNSTNERLREWEIEFIKLISCRNLRVLLEKKVEFKEFETALDSLGITSHFLNSSTFGDIRLNRKWETKEEYLESFKPFDENDWEEHRQTKEKRFPFFFSSIVKSAITLYEFEFISWLLGLYERTKCERRFDGRDLLNNLSEYTHRMNQESLAACIDNVRSELDMIPKIKQEIESCSRELQRLFTVGGSIATIEKVFSTQSLLIDQDPGGFHFFTYNDVICHNYSSHIYPDRKGYITPLDYAAREGYTHIVEWFLSKPVTNSLLIKAINSSTYYGQLPTLQLLMSRLDFSLSSSSSVPLSPSIPSSSIISPSIGASLLEATLNATGSLYFRENNWCHLTIVQYLLPKLLSLGVDINSGTLIQDTSFNPNRKRKEKEALLEEENKVRMMMTQSILFRSVQSITCNDSIEGWMLLRWLVKQEAIDLNKEIEYQLSSDFPIENNRCLFVHILDAWRSNHLSSDKTEEHYSLQLAHCIRVMEFLIKNGHNAIKNSTKIINTLTKNVPYSEIGRLHSVELMHFFSNNGYDIQNIEGMWMFLDETKAISHLQTTQVHRWRVATEILRGSSITSLTQILNSDTLALATKFRDGGTLLHVSRGTFTDDSVAALSDRVDVFNWLVVTYELNIYAVDGYGRSVMSLAHSAGSTGCEDAIRRIESARIIKKAVFKYMKKLRYLTLNRLRDQASVILQTKVRQHQAYSRYGPVLLSSRTVRARTRMVWAAVIKALKGKGEDKHLVVFSWGQAKIQYDMVAGDSTASDSDERKDGGDCRSEKEEAVLRDLIAATAVMVVPRGSNSGDGEEVDIEKDGDIVSASVITPTIHMSPQRSMDTVEFTQSVVKWLEKADKKYRHMFCRVIEQLANGDRSYALSKRLTHCLHPIFEAKLDAGQRILWTKIQRGEGWREGKATRLESIMIWFVSKHDDVPRCVMLIDRSCARLSLYQPQGEKIAVEEEGDGESEGFLGISDDMVLLDPFGNAPLKVYATARKDFPLLSQSAWKPSLLLSSREMEIKKQTGTVLLLGRSGTGKTLCLCHRMMRDRESTMIQDRDSVASSPRQLFVSRSKRLCELVRSYQQQRYACSGRDEEMMQADFLTLDVFVERMEVVVSRECGHSIVSYRPSRRVDFKRFDEMYIHMRGKSSLSALLVWTQIRSFLKGSIEAVVKGSALTLAEYLDNAFGKERCRLSQEQRTEVYFIYTKYEEDLRTQGRWDDADRVAELLIRSKLEPLMACNGHGRDYEKVYVDEVQDNTQAEVVLYFLAAGLDTKALFFAGGDDDNNDDDDIRIEITHTKNKSIRCRFNITTSKFELFIGDPAQCVEEGVDFRFEEVRSVVHKLSGGQESIHKPMKLLVNYRSHSGILNCASAVLEKMFLMFPGSAKVLPKDSGLYLGPRPVFYQADIVGNSREGLFRILKSNERLVVLCPDHVAEPLEGMLQTNGVSNIVLGIREAKGLEFPDVLLVDFFCSIPSADQRAWKQTLRDGKGVMEEYAFPQLETQLKVLYTAITRCCNRLLFVETKLSQAGTAFFRMLSTRQLGERFFFSPLEESMINMTADEWRVRGIEFALSADGHGAGSFLRKAVMCFDRAGDFQLKEKAAAHQEVEAMKCRVIRCDGSLLSLDEGDAAHAVLRSIKALLLFEAYSLCLLVEPLLSDTATGKGSPQQYPIFRSKVVNELANLLKLKKI